MLQKGASTKSPFEKTSDSHNSNQFVQKFTETRKQIETEGVKVVRLKGVC